ncbi:rRNA maturation RNase YbeY [Tropicibacter naphthalenivorans]|uniref:Endoribonuclease YbeY n=1 Tax=Tropicibacter naphthalenivorans TaxID=441103 RepID=A0A0P1GK50_9RHOB|nr:rRNA maturation RNase YbeY [Tropicibacter naphthalenivorans]CUH82492.1 Endoribonuclease YbeY [Tropicibacter naphthalenivorans]SMD07021.1 probable rRNA maturation factor [Tropicibacter naphthalenivorans]
MQIDTIYEDDRWQAADLETLAEPAIAQTFAQLGLDPAPYEIAILACDDARIAVLNAEFREKPTPTNVLSWPSEDLAADTDGDTPYAPEPEDDEHHLGDIAISYDTCAREAQEAHKPFSAHVTHLIVHGTLHLLGYDHIRDADATLMEGLETVILGKLGLPDPYSQDQGPDGPATGKD